MNGNCEAAISHGDMALISWEYALFPGARVTPQTGRSERAVYGVPNPSTLLH